VRIGGKSAMAVGGIDAPASCYRQTSDYRACVDISSSFAKKYHSISISQGSVGLLSVARV